MEITKLEVEIKVPLTLSQAKVEEILDEEDVPHGDIEEEVEIHKLVEAYIERNAKAFIGDAAKARADVCG